MKIAFVGKGGSGKTTLTTTFTKWIMDTKNVSDILIIDADHNVHIRQNLESANIQIHNFTCDGILKTDANIIRTSLPKNQEALLYFKDIIHGAQLLEVGKLGTIREGSGCYHGQISDIEIFLNHLIDEKEDWIVSDMTAGTDIFGSSYFAKFDILIGICEPTQESMEVIKDISARTQKYQIPFYYIINKYYDDSDIRYIHDSIGSANQIGQIPHQRIRKVDEIQIDNCVFENIHKAIMSHEKKWNIFEINNRILHEKNRNTWAKTAPEQSHFSYDELVSTLGIR